MEKVNLIKGNYRLVVWPTGNNFLTEGVCREDCVGIRDEILRHVGEIDEVEIVCDGLKGRAKPEHYLFYVDLKDVVVDGKHYEILLTIKQKEISP